MKSQVVAVGAVGSVVLAGSALAEYEALKTERHSLATKQQKTIERVINDLANRSEWHQIGDEKFKREGKYPVNQKGDAVTVYAIKAFKFRLYGSFVQKDDKRVFVATRVDPAKKRDRIPPDIMIRTAHDVANFTAH